jgi:hypothetical protein
MPPARTEEFWKDPDVLWLAGINNSAGIEYLNKERFEELLCWLTLPRLVGIAASDPFLLKDVTGVTASASHLVAQLESSSFEYRQFLELIRDEPI